ncbi:MAG: polyprenyl synthetase family protein [Taibaiella sp.]|nr:polyprenyl synthetase family protein [Taibaiella sp.]
MHSFSQLAQQFEERFINSPLFPAQPENLYAPCSYLLTLGGKRIRPALCVMGNELFAEAGEDAWHAAAAIELFHNFTLIHDDIMDKAPLRRGHPTIHAKYGLTAGILCGDITCIYAYEQLGKVNSSLHRILPIFNKTAIEVCEGQQLDMDFEMRNDVTIAEYINMISLKTSVLLACSLKIGALLGGATEGNAGRLYSFGKNMGIAFQLQDDYLDAYGTTDKLGKQNGGDIKANKKTYLLLKAIENATDQQQKEISSWMDNEGEYKIPAILDLYTSTGADIACRDAVAEYSQRAFDCLEEVAATATRKQHLHELAAYLLQREK